MKIYKNKDIKDLDDILKRIELIKKKKDYHDRINDNTYNWLFKLADEIVKNLKKIKEPLNKKL